MSKRQVILHIGLHKTGTTFLQRCLFENRSRLTDGGYFLPAVEAGRVVAAHNLAREIRRTDRFNPNGMHWSKVLADFEASPASTLLLTSEVFSLSGADNIARYRELLSAYDVKIVMCFRHPVDLIQSMYSQVSKTDQKKVFAAYVTGRLAKGDRYHFHQFYRKWADAFGPANVTVLFYEVMREDLFAHFLDAIGAAPLFATIPPVRPEQEVINASADERVVYLRVACAAKAKERDLDPAVFDAVVRPRIEALADHCGWQGRKLRLVTSELAAKIEAACAAEIAALNAVVPVPESYFTFPPNRADDEPSTEDLVLDSLVEALVAGELALPNEMRPTPRWRRWWPFR